MSNIKISVIIPFYKGEKYIQQAVNSILNQPHENIELLLINDGSPTGGELCQSIALKDTRIKYFCKENEGIGATRNFGIEKATGDYLAFLDQDDAWVNEFLTEDTIQQINNGGDVIGFSFYNCNENLTRGSLVRMSEKTCSGGGQTAQECVNHHSSLFIKRELLKDTDIRYALTRHEDVIFIQKALYVANKVTYIDKVMFLYRNNSSSETHSNIDVVDMYAPLLQSWRDLLDWYLTKHPTDIDTIKTVKHMICVYAMEAVEHLYQTGINEEKAEPIINQYFCRDFLDNYKDIVLSKNRYEQIHEYYDNRNEFINKQRKIGKRLKLKNKFRIFRRFYHIKKYKDKIPKEYLFN